MPEETFRWVIAGAVGISTLCIVAVAVIAFLVYRIAIRVHDHTVEAMERVGPVVSKASFVLDEVKPIAISLKKLSDENGPKFSAAASRVVEIADHARDISAVARDQAHRFAEVGKDIADRTTAKVALVDAAVEDTVDQVQLAGSNLKDVAMKPVREASGLIAGVRAAVSTYAAGRRSGVERIAQDEEMFI